MNALVQDLRYAVRSLRHSPGFTLVAVLTLALGIGANSAIFSVVHAVLLRPFPYEDPGRLVVVWETQLEYGLPFMYASPPNYADWREQNQVFEEMGVFATRAFFLADSDEPVRIPGARVSASLFDLLGASPQLGRVFGAEEDRPGEGRVVLLSDGLWKGRFGADPGVIGRAITLDEETHTVVGVMTADFRFPPPIDLEGSAASEACEMWVPLARDLKGSPRGAHFLTTVARLEEGVSLERAEAEMVTIAGRLEADFPDSNAGWSVTLVPLDEEALGDFRPALLVLLGAVGFVLLIACVNVANLQLARGAGRQREYAIRAALGASRGRLVRQMLTESLALALLGGAAGLAAAFWGLQVLLRLAPQDVPRLDEVSVDLPVAGFALATSIVVGVLFGMLPAIQGASADVNRWLKQGGRGSGPGLGASRLRGALVVAEIALSLVLLVGAGLLAQSFLNLRGVDPGFQPQDVLTLRVSLPRSSYSEPEQRVAAFRELERRVRATPLVEAGGFIYDIPMSADREGTSFTIEGDPPPGPGEGRIINYSFVTPGYFEAMGIRLHRGRHFSERDEAGAPEVVAVNESLASRFFAERDPLRARIHLGSPQQAPRRIVGVVANVKHDSLDRDPMPMVYVPYYQAARARSMSMAVRGAAPPAQLLSSVRAQVRGFVAGASIYDVKTMRQIVSESLARSRFSALLLGGFAMVALALAAVGIYGVISFTVARRTAEIGIRTAMGARPRQVVGMVLGHGMSLALTGVGVGLVAALALTRVLQSLLFAVTAQDPLTFAALSGVLVGVAALACWLPARRASRIDPMVALRYE